MSTGTSTALLDPQVWTGKIFNGEWIAPGGGEYQVIEPATGLNAGDREKLSFRMEIVVLVKPETT